jgi:DNA-binding IclR family transcriptional regulator
MSNTEAEPEDYLNTFNLEAHTTNTITNVNSLKTHLVRVVNKGIAMDDEEYFQGVINVAAGIKDGEGKLRESEGVLGPSVRLTWSHMQEIIPNVKPCALSISNELGYKEN